jgi:hypothetical protein
MATQVQLHDHNITRVKGPLVASNQGQLPAWDNDTNIEYLQQPVIGLGRQCNRTLAPTVRS